MTNIFLLSAALSTLLLLGQGVALATSVQPGADSPAPTENVVDLLVDEVEEDVAGYFQKSGLTNDDLELLKAFRAADLVNRRVDPWKYTARYGKQSIALTPESALASGAGQCGNSAAVLIEIYRKLDLKTRSVQMYYFNEDRLRNESHAAVEVFAKDKWRYVDPFFGLFFLGKNTENIIKGLDSWLSLHEVRALSDKVSHMYSDGFSIFTGHKNNVPDYLHFPSDYILGGVGSYSLQRKENKYIPNAQPNFIGKNSQEDYGTDTRGNISVNLLSVPASTKLIEFVGVALGGWAPSGVMVLRSGENLEEIKIKRDGEKRLRVELPEGFLNGIINISILPDSGGKKDTLYLVYNEIIVAY